MATKKYTHGFTIDRAKWLSGDSDERDAKFGEGTRSLMLDDEGRMCCLGFFMGSCGVAKKHMLDWGNPDDVRAQRGSVPKKTKFLFEQIDFSNFILANDAIGQENELTRKGRETKIKKLFAENGVKVTFEGRYPKVAA